MNENIIEKSKNGKIKVGCKRKDNTVRYFLAGVAVLTVISFLSLDIEWIKLFSRLPEIPRIFVKLFTFNFAKWGQIVTSFLETVSVAVLSTFLGIILGMFLLCLRRIISFAYDSCQRL